MQKGVILGCGNRSNAGMDTVTLPYYHLGGSNIITFSDKYIELSVQKPVW
jgi:hypothetical protein